METSRNHAPDRASVQRTGAPRRPANASKLELPLFVRGLSIAPCNISLAGTPAIFNPTHTPRFSATARKSTALPLSAAVSCICTPFACHSPSVSALALRPWCAVLRSPKSLCVSRIRHPSSNAPLHRLRTARKRTVHNPLPQPPTTGNLTCIHLLLLQTP